MDNSKVIDVLEKCSNLVVNGQMEENVYLDLCTEFGKAYRDNKPQRDEPSIDRPREIDMYGDNLYDSEDSDEEERSEPSASQIEEIQRLHREDNRIERERCDREPYFLEHVNVQCFEHLHAAWAVRKTMTLNYMTDEWDPAPDYKDYDDLSRWRYRYYEWDTRTASRDPLDGGRPCGRFGGRPRKTDDRALREEAEKYFAGERVEAPYISIRSLLNERYYMIGVVQPKRATADERESTTRTRNKREPTTLFRLGLVGVFD